MLIVTLLFKSAIDFVNVSLCPFLALYTMSLFSNLILVRDFNIDYFVPEV